MTEFLRQIIAAIISVEQSPRAAANTCAAQAYSYIEHHKIDSPLRQSQSQHPASD